MSFITKPLGGIIGSITGSTQADAAKDAANQQQAGAASANQILQQQYDTTRGDLSNYRNLGTSSINPLIQALGYQQAGAGTDLIKDGSSPLQQQFSYGDYQGQSPFSYAAFSAPTAAEAAATPGYQFTLDQGLKAAQNSASARGLGSSGAAVKGAQSYATGLADSTYGDTFNRALQGYQTNYGDALNTYNTNETNGLNTYNTNRGNALGNFTTNYGVASDNANRLLGLVNTGQAAAAGTASAGAQTANSIANNTTSAAAAGAAGTVGAANAYGNTLNNALNIGTTLYGINTLGARK